MVTAALMKLDLPHLRPEINRHGKPVLYVRIGDGPRIRIKEKRGTQAFLAAYGVAVERLSRPPVPQAPSGSRAYAAGTLGWLTAEYFGSDEFKALEEKSQATRRGVIEGCLVEPHTDSDPERMGHCPIQFFDSKKVKRLRDLKAKAGFLGAANNRRKYLSAMFGWAIEAEIDGIGSNPCRDVRKKRYATDGFYTWKLTDVAKYCERHKIGTKARLALALYLFVGVRRSDMVRLGRSMVIERQAIDKDGAPYIARSIKFTVRKSRHRKLTETEKPILPILWDIIQASPCGTETFLETEYGKPFTAKGVGNYMRNRCDEAGLPQCTSHGVRKIAATIVAENGASVHQLMAIFDWVTLQQAETYTREASRRRLAQDAMHLLATPFTANTATAGGLH